MYSRTKMQGLALLALGIALVTPQPACGSSSGEPGRDAPTPAASRTRIYFGMWTSHVRDPSAGLDGNSLIGLAYHGFYGATFINSYGDRSVAAGIQRSFTSPKEGTLTTALGYRVGLVSGYDERLVGIARKVPVLPFVQLVGTMDHGKLGIELAYSGLAVSILVNWRL